MKSDDIKYPFFAYGIFKKGNIGFPNIANHAKKVESENLDGGLLQRDGLPLFNPNARGKINGSLITFNNRDDAIKAYKKILRIEPKHQYKWGKIVINEQGDEANILIGNLFIRLCLKLLREFKSNSMTILHN